MSPRQAGIKGYFPCTEKTIFMDNNDKTVWNAATALKNVFSDDCTGAKSISVSFHPHTAQSKNVVSLIRISWFILLPRLPKLYSKTVLTEFSKE